MVQGSEVNPPSAASSEEMNQLKAQVLRYVVVGVVWGWSFPVESLCCILTCIDKYLYGLWSGLSY